MNIKSCTYVFPLLPGFGQKLNRNFFRFYNITNIDNNLTYNLIASYSFKKKLF